MIVWPSPLDVSTYAASGRDVNPPVVRCPACGGPTGPWSGYRRYLRADEPHVVFVPRVRCRDCGRTDALLPWFMVPYRYDTVDVIGAALELHVGGLGVRRIAAALGRPETTVREWCRRFGRVAADLARVVLAAAVERGWSGFDLPTAPRPRATAAVAVLASAWRRRRGPVEGWRVAALITGGTLLAPNTGSPLAPATAAPLMAGTSRPRPGGDPWPPATPPKRSPSGDTT
ncbi:MAG: transposase [Bellilinea sp.]